MGPNTGLGQAHVHVPDLVGGAKIGLHGHSVQRTREGTNPALPTNAGRIDTFETEMALEQSGRELDRKLNMDLKNQHPSQHPIQAMYSRSSSRMMMMMMMMFILK